MQIYTKINTLYKRFQNLGKVELPKKDWIRFQNVIQPRAYSNPAFELLTTNILLECYSKIDGTNSKIAYFPSTGEIKVGGKTDKASSQSGQFEFLQKIADRILPSLKEMYPPECAKFAPKGDANGIYYYSLDLDEPVAIKAGKVLVELEEVPVYIYGEYFGKGIQKCGSRYSDGNDFVVFDIQQQGWWLPKEMRDSICQKLGLHQVPFIGYLTLDEAEDMVTKGFPTRENAKDPTLLEEGIVARPKIPFKDTKGNRVIVKLKHCDYVKFKKAFEAGTKEDYLEFEKWYEGNVENIEN